MDAIEGLAVVGADYAHRPVSEAFTWAACEAAVEPGEWYMVAFRSVRRDDADEARLTLHDDLAHAEATAVPGFVHYYRGPRALDGSCLSFCLWMDRVDARAAAGLPAHARAAALVAEMYATYTLEFLRVRKVTGAPLSFEPWDAPDTARRVAA